MARRERERYTERNRPHRKSVSRPVEKQPPDGFNNPVVLVALGGLVVAIFLLLAFLFARSRTQTTETAATTPGAEATTVATEAAITQTELITDTAALKGVEGITETEGITATEGITGTDGVTGTVLYLPESGTPYKQPDDMGLKAGEETVFVDFTTDKGDIRVELWPEIAPAHVNSFVFLAEKGFFDGLTFHRVEGWVVQGGDPTGTGGGGPGYAVPAEFNADDPVPHVYGTFAMARTADPDSGGSQFYFIKDPEGAAHLNGQYTVYGHVVKGMDVVAELAANDKMTAVTVTRAPIADREVSPDDIRAGNLPESPTGETATE